MPINIEKRKEYNAKYYASKKAEIAQKLYAKEECEHCSRIVSHQNMKNHLPNIFFALVRHSLSYKYALYLTSFTNSILTLNSS